MYLVKSFTLTGVRDMPVIKLVGVGTAIAELTKVLLFSMERLCSKLV